MAITARRALCSVVVAVAITTISLHAAPKISFEQRAVVAEKVTPGATTTWLAITHEPQPWHMRAREHARQIADDDRDGIVRFELNGDVPPESLWVVVDMSSGDWTTAEPGNGKVRARALKPPTVNRRESGKPARVSQDDIHVKFWVIRPGRGAWVRTSVDGGFGDEDPDDGSASASLERFTPVGDSPPAPADFERDDVVIIVDPLKLGIFELRVRD